MADSKSKTARYECISPVDHDGERINVGDVVEFPVDAGEVLVSAGAFKPAGKAPAPAQG